MDILLIVKENIYPHSQDKCIYNENYMFDKKKDSGQMNTCYMVNCNTCPVETANAMAPNPRQQSGKVAGTRRKSKVILNKQNCMGTFGRSMHARCAKHLDAINKLDLKNSTAKHITEKHANDVENTLFTMKTLSIHMHTLHGYTIESVYIEKQIQQLPMHSMLPPHTGPNLVDYVLLC